MSTKSVYFLIFCICLLLLAGCGPQAAQGGSDQMSYKEMKDMVVDILKTKDAQKAIEEGSSSSRGTGMKMLTAGENQLIQTAVKDVLTDPAFEKQFEKVMTDPKFAGEFAKVVNKQNKQIHKDLMKDPQYQKAMVENMKNPEYQKILLDVMKGSEYRKQIMTIMQESLESPLFKLKLMGLFEKAVEEQLKPESEKKKKGGGK